MGVYFNPNNGSFTKDRNYKIYVDKTELLVYLNEAIGAPKNCFAVSHAETIAVMLSVTGAAIHTPVIPHMAGKINVNASSRTIPLRDEMSADDLASPQLVKYIELITS